MKLPKRIASLLKPFRKPYVQPTPNWQELSKPVPENVVKFYKEQQQIDSMNNLRNLLRGIGKRKPPAT